MELWQNLLYDAHKKCPTTRGCVQVSQITIEDGRLLVKTARSTVAAFLECGHVQPDDKFDSRFSYKSGVFVTLNDQSGLRGCIGYVVPNKSLSLTLKDAAIAAATKDSRFPPLSLNDLSVVTFEVTILTPPETIFVDSPEQLLHKIKVGRDGLIVSNRYYSGLLLPQVPLEYGWNEMEFLEHTCQKAELSKDCWKHPETQVQRFEGIIFKEEQPNGHIIEGEL